MKIQIILFFLFLYSTLTHVKANEEKSDFSKNVVHFTVQDDIDDYLLEGTFFLYIYAPWCGYCKRTIPLISKVADKLEGTGIKVVAVDGDAHKDIAIRFFIEGFPSIYFIKDGQVYVYNDERLLDSFLEFSRNGYKLANPISIFFNPLGFFGWTLGKTAQVGVALFKLGEHIIKEYGLPNWAVAILGMVLICGGSLVAILFLLLSVDLLTKLFSSSAQAAVKSLTKEETEKKSDPVMNIDLESKKNK